MHFTDPNLGEPQSSGETDAPMMPIGVGEADDFSEGGDLAFDDIGAAGPRRKLNGGGLVLLAVVATAVAGLYSMRTLTKATAASDHLSAVEESINQSIDSLIGGMTKTEGDVKAASSEGVLDVLTGSYTQRQVELSHVQRDPFIIFEEERIVAAPAAPEPVDPKIQLRRERTQLFEQAGARIRVRMIMMGSAPMANIDNKIVRVGESVLIEPENVSFRVQSIVADHVVLVAEDASLDVSVPIVAALRRDR